MVVQKMVKDSVEIREGKEHENVRASDVGEHP